jgi:hypothetical protein
MCRDAAGAALGGGNRQHLGDAVIEALLCVKLLHLRGLHCPQVSCRADAAVVWASAVRGCCWDGFGIA